jgi:DNA-binding MarR family transcriptional regulator
MAKTKLDVSLLENIWRLSNTSTRHIEAMLQDLTECSLPQFLVLRALSAERAEPSLDARRRRALSDHEGAMASTDIGRMLGCSKANAGQLVTRLEEAGRIEKSANGTDGRVVALRLTAKGARTEARCETQLAEEANHVFSKLTAREKKQLLALLEKVTSPSAASPS